VVGARHSIPASGNWSGLVYMSLDLFQRLRKAPPSQKPLHIKYIDGKLKIGTTLLKAIWREDNK